MPLTSKQHKDNQGAKSGLLLAAALMLALSIIGGACAGTPRKDAKSKAQDSGLIFPHDKHVGGDLALECGNCHDTSAESGLPTLAMPGHELCALCHEIPEAENGEYTPELMAREECNFCHSRPDRSVDASLARLTEEILFSHARHETAEVSCDTCHGNLDAGASLPRGALKPFCMDCHGRQTPALNDCAVCHNTINKDTIPTSRDGKPLAHDAPWIWETVHGREAMVSPMFCALCHDHQESCADCHSRTAPKDHTLSFRDRTHGLRAAWDRSRCATCHEEDSCQKCHNNMAPGNHRAGWAGLANRHCVNCHYPPEQTGCATCHENMEHRSAKPSPHLFGVYPPNCAQCHPGGLPHRAPHPVNSTVQCVVCHN